MGIKRYKPEEIVTKLRKIEVLSGQGMPRVDAIRQVQITPTSPGGHRSDGTQANHALTFRMDLSGGADHSLHGLTVVGRSAIRETRIMVAALPSSEK